MWAQIKVFDLITATTPPSNGAMEHQAASYNFYTLAIQLMEGERHTVPHASNCLQKGHSNVAVQGFAQITGRHFQM